jgi:hypothetical protein
MSSTFTLTEHEEIYTSPHDRATLDAKAGDRCSQPK